MPLTQHFIIEGRYLGSCQRQKLMIHATLQEPQSYAWFCLGCGDIWARAPVEGGEMRDWWRVVGGNCRKHPGFPSHVPGSLMLSWEPEFNELFPDELVKWEFDRHLNYMEHKLK